VSKADWLQLFTLVGGFFSALAAWWSRRSNKQLQPRPGRVARIEKAKVAADAGKVPDTVSVRDLVLGALDETVDLGRRVGRIETYLKLEE